MPIYRVKWVKDVTTYDYEATDPNEVLKALALETHTFSGPALLSLVTIAPQNDPNGNPTWERNYQIRPTGAQATLIRKGREPMSG